MPIAPQQYGNMQTPKAMRTAAETVEHIENSGGVDSLTTPEVERFAKRLDIGIASAQNPGSFPNTQKQIESISGVATRLLTFTIPNSSPASGVPSLVSQEPKTQQAPSLADSSTGDDSSTGELGVPARPFARTPAKQGGLPGRRGLDDHTTSVPDQKNSGNILGQQTIWKWKTLQTKKARHRKQIQGKELDQMKSC